MDISEVNQKEVETIFLWTNPRSLSTVFTKCISFVDNTQIWFEPYGCAFGNKLYCDQNNHTKMNMNSSYLRSFTEDQGEVPTSTSWSSKSWFEENVMTYPWVKAQLETQQPRERCRFIKNMAYTINGDIDFEYLPNVKYQHTFLIRNPLFVYPSCKAALIADAASSSDLTDIENVNLVNDYPYFPTKRFYDTMYKLWCAVESVKGRATVIDADELCNKPEVLLRKYFEAVGLTWREQYLSWNPNTEITKEWITAKERMNPKSVMYRVWYRKALESSNFIPTNKCVPCVDDLSPDLRECVEKAMPYYEEMFESRIKVGDVKI